MACRSGCRHTSSRSIKRPWPWSTIGLGRVTFGNEFMHHDGLGLWTTGSGVGQQSDIDFPWVTGYFARPVVYPSSWSDCCKLTKRVEASGATARRLRTGEQIKVNTDGQGRLHSSCSSLGWPAEWTHLYWRGGQEFRMTLCMIEWLV